MPVTDIFDRRAAPSLDLHRAVLQREWRREAASG
jgi:hypothetical protein